MAAVSKSFSSSSSHPTRTLQSASSVSLSALGHASNLMRSLVRLHVNKYAPISLSTNYISMVGFQGNPSDLLCISQRNQTNNDRLHETRSSKDSAPCKFHIPASFTAHLKTLKSEVVQVLFGMEVELEFNPLLTEAEPPISTTLVAMELASPQGKPLPIQDLHPDQAIRVTLPNKYPFAPKSGDSDRSKDKAANKTCLTLTLPTNGSLNFSVKAVDGLDENAGLYISFNFSLEPGTVDHSSVSRINHCFLVFQCIASSRHSQICI